MKKYLLPALLMAFISCKPGDKKDAPTATTDTTTTATTDTTSDPATAPPASGKIDIESFGDIKIGQPHTETIKALGKPDKKSKAEEWGADGLMHEDWTYSSKGIVINFAGDKGSANKTIFSINANAPCLFKTRAGMGIDNSYMEVQEAYKRDINAGTTNKEQITVGSIYGGIIFTFKNEKVTAVFLGAAAE